MKNRPDANYVESSETHDMSSSRDIRGRETIYESTYEANHYRDRNQVRKTKRDYHLKHNIEKTCNGEVCHTPRIL